MEKFVVEELRGIVQSELSVVRRVILWVVALDIWLNRVQWPCAQQDPERTSIFGHSMGGEPFRPCLSIHPTSSQLTETRPMFCRPRSSFSLPKIPGTVQVCLGIRSHLVRPLAIARFQYAPHPFITPSPRKRL